MYKIQQLMKKDMQLVDQVIHDDLNCDVALIRQISKYIINSGGKRIRPLLTLLCGRIAGFSEGEGVLLHQMAAMIEYIHTATLLHDDVVDEADMRRGHKTANAVFGNAASVLVGDFIYTRAFQMMVKSNSVRLLQVMADSTNKISEGEVLQLLNIGRSNITDTEYFQVIRYKTGVLFEASARVAAIISRAEAKIEDCLAKYALNIGTAFQIADDMLDYSGDIQVVGKNIGSDLAEGKITLPLIYALQQANSADKQSIIDAVENPQTAKIEKISLLIKNSQSLKYCSDIAHKYVEQAVSELNIFAPSVYKDALTELAYSTVERIS